MANGGQGSLFPETEKIIALLSCESEQDVVILAIPSHDRKKNELPDRDQWAEEALQLMGDLYRGATAYRTFKGIYKTDDGEYLYDEPILIESIALEAEIEDPERLQLLIGFAKRMGKQTNQACVMLVFGNKMVYIDDYSGV